MIAGKYKVIHCVEIQDGTFALAGVVEGELPDVGSVGISLNPSIRVEVLGIGVVDPNLVAPDTHGLLVKIVNGGGRDLNDALLEFASCSVEATE